MYWPVDQLPLTFNQTGLPGAVECPVQNLLKGRAFAPSAVPAGLWWPPLGCDQKVAAHNDFAGFFQMIFETEIPVVIGADRPGIGFKDKMGVSLGLCPWHRAYTLTFGKPLR